MPICTPPRILAGNSEVETVETRDIFQELRTDTLWLIPEARLVADFWDKIQFLVIHSSDLASQCA